MKPDVVIASAAAVPALVDLVNSAYRGDSSRAGWTTEADLLGGQRIDAVQLTETIERPGNVVLILGPTEHPLACVNLVHEGDAAYLGMLTVRPAQQAAGLGRMMLETAEKWVRETWNAKAIRMRVIIQRTELIAWYERRGYARTGELDPFPYGDPRFGLPKRDDLQFVILRKTFA